MAAGFYGIACYRPKFETNVGSLWRAADLYGASFIATVGARYKRRQASDTAHTAMNLPLHHYDSIDDLLHHLPFSCPLVGVELDPRAVPLPEFHHPARAVYLMGAEDHGLPPSVVDACHFLVQIPTPVNRSMNVACAGSTVLYDRHAFPGRRLTRRGMEAVAS